VTLAPGRQAPARLGLRVLVDDGNAGLSSAEDEVGIVAAPPPAREDFTDARVGELEPEERGARNVRLGPAADMSGRPSDYSPPNGD
jgi:hypothetical protein